jgi:hypothetical protein
MPPFIVRIALIAATVAVERSVHWLFDEMQKEDQ